MTYILDYHPDFIKEELLDLFRAYGLKVAVGLNNKDGVVIRSQDDRIDCQNTGRITIDEGSS